MKSISLFLIFLCCDARHLLPALTLFDSHSPSSSYFLSLISLPFCRQHYFTSHLSLYNSHYCRVADFNSSNSSMKRWVESSLNSSYRYYLPYHSALHCITLLSVAYPTLPYPTLSYLIDLYCRLLTHTSSVTFSFYVAYVPPSFSLSLSTLFFSS